MSGEITYRQWQATSVSPNFRAATSLVTRQIPASSSLAPNTALVKNAFVGINASDVNFTAGKYIPGVKPPFDVGFEGLAQVIAIGPEGAGKRKLPPLSVGQWIVYTCFGAFAEYRVIDGSATIFPVPSPDPAFLALPVSGLTAAISLGEMGDLLVRKSKLGRPPVAMVTAAAGGTGQFAVQLLKKVYGCTVVGTCSDAQKADFLRSLGCDRPINYKAENVHDVLKREFPNGVDVVYESVGGKMFQDCLRNVATRGTLIVIGSVSGYQDGSSWKTTASEGGAIGTSGFFNPTLLLGKSVSVRGFFLNHFTHVAPKYTSQLLSLYQRGEIVVAVDSGPSSTFVGIETVPDAVEYMYSGKSVGKVVVKLQGNRSSL